MPFVLICAVTVRCGVSAIDYAHAVVVREDWVITCMDQLLNDTAVQAVEMTECGDRHTWKAH